MDNKKVWITGLLLVITHTAFAEPGTRCPARSPLPADIGYFMDAVALGNRWKDPSELTQLPEHKRAFCSSHLSRTLSSRLLDHTNPDLIEKNKRVNRNDTLAFSNPPGPIKAGMCWLHSRLQRQFTYLANFRPSLPKPTEDEVDVIIDRIVYRKGVTEIPGFRNLNEFSKHYKNKLVSKINAMGWACFFNPSDCAARLNDAYSPEATEVATRMQSLHQLMLQQPGQVQMVRTRLVSQKKDFGAVFKAHSLLILGMTPLSGKTLTSPIRGYEMKVIDPNIPDSIETVTYLFGDTHLMAGFKKVILYPHYEYAGDIPAMTEKISEYCQPAITDSE